MMSSEQLAVRGGVVGRAASCSVVAGNGNWGGAGGTEQITVVRIGDTHITEEQSYVGGKVKGDVSQCYEMEYLMPEEEEDEEDSTFVIEYSNPEEEGESYQFTMSLDRSLPDKKPIVKQPVVGEIVRAPVTSRPPRPRQEARRKRRQIKEEVKKEEEEVVVSNKSVLELGEDYNDVMTSGAGGKQLLCPLCPPPSKFFKRASGLAVHLKQMHDMERKTFFCTSCQLALRSQLELDTHIKRHATQDAVFTCPLCSAATGNTTDDVGFKGSRWGLRMHLKKEHPGVVPRCHICSKSFRTVPSYLADQFRHVGVTPYFCAKCHIYEMTERGMKVHIRNHKKKEWPPGENDPPTVALTAADNSATDDSDF